MGSADEDDDWRVPIMQMTEHVDEEQLTDKKADEKLKHLSIMRSNLNQGCWGRLMVTQDDAGEDEEDEYIVSYDELFIFHIDEEEK